MKKRKRCNLCGAKLSGDICRECGYNNAAYDYHVNESKNTCHHSSSERFYTEEDHERHSSPEPVPVDVSETWGEDPEKDSGGNSKKNSGSSKDGYGKKRNRKGTEQKKPKSKLVTACFIICIVISMFAQITKLTGKIQEAFQEAFQEEETTRSYAWEETAEEEPDTKASPVRVAPAEKEEIGQEAGEMLLEEASSEDAQTEAASTEAAAVPSDEQFSEMIGAGFYVAGISFPADIYDLEWSSGSGVVTCWSTTEDFYFACKYLYEGEDGDPMRMEELELNQGTIVTISDTLMGTLSSRETEGYADPMPEKQEFKTVQVESVVKAGDDLEAGTYRVVWVSGDEQTSEALYTYTDTEGSKRSSTIEFCGECKQYENLILRERDVLVPLNCQLKLETAEYDLSAYSMQQY